MVKNDYRSTLTSWHLISRKWRPAIVLRVEQYVPAPLWSFKWQKYGHHREASRGRQTWAKCGEKDPGHMEEDCLKEIRCANCQDHLAYIRSFDVFRKEKEILEVKHKRKVSFLEARKIVGTYMGKNSYASIARRADTANKDNKYRTLMEKLIQLEANDWPKFQEHLKNYTQSNFTKHQFSKKLRMGRHPMLQSKQKHM